MNMSVLCVNIGSSMFTKETRRRHRKRWEWFDQLVVLHFTFICVQRGLSRMMARPFSGYGARLGKLPGDEGGICMTAWVAALRAQPSWLFRNRRSFYVTYDGFYLVLCASACAVLAGSGFEGLVPTFDWWMLAFVPVSMYVLILCHVFIHNCSHGNFPRPINRLVGEICGLLVLTRYASWEIIHRRHHKYSDDVEHDPHPVVPSYWRFVWNSMLNVERQLQRQFYEFHGDTPENRRFEKNRALTSYFTNVVLIAAWYLLLGPAAFFVWFVPGTIAAFLHVNHFNWVTHNAHHPEEGFAPINLDEGIYWLGNRIFFGIYYHKNHHDYSGLFNPRHLERHKERARRERALATG